MSVTDLPSSPAPEVNIDLAVVQFRPLADWWANRIQWCEDDHEDLVQEGMLELIKTLRGYNKSGRPIQDVKAIASVCFSAAMKWWYKKSDRNMEFTGIDHLRLPIDNVEVYFSQIYVDQYLSELERIHGRIAREIIENLIDPGDAVGRIALGRMKQKQAMRQEGGKRVIGYSSVGKIQKQHVRELVRLESNEFDRIMLEIKNFTKEFMCRGQRNLN